MMTKYVKYSRLSVEDKKRTQHGFDSQNLDMQFFLDQQENPEVIGNFEEFISGAADYKPELEKAMELCRKEEAILLIAKVDRLSRRVSQVATYLEGDVEFKVACMPLADNFQIHIYSSLAEQERKFIKDRVTRGLHAAKEKGVKFGAASDKYKNNKLKGLHSAAQERNTQKQHDALQPTVKIIKDIVDFSNGSASLDNIADKLNERGVLTPRGKPYTKASVSRVCKQMNIERKKCNKWS